MKFKATALIAAVVLTLAFFMFGCVTQPQVQEGNQANLTNQTNKTPTLLPPAASLRPHVTTPSPYPTALPSITPAPFLECASDSDCVVSGSSSEVCAKKKYETPQVYKPEFECLKLTTCGCNNATCGWNKTEAFTTCLKSKTKS